MKIGWRIRRDALCRDVCAHSQVRSNGTHTCRQKTPARMRHPGKLTETAFSTLRGSRQRTVICIGRRPQEFRQAKSPSPQARDLLRRPTSLPSRDRRVEKPPARNESVLKTKGIARIGWNMSLCPFLMSFRGPKAHGDRLQKVESAPARDDNMDAPAPPPSAPCLDGLEAEKVPTPFLHSATLAPPSSGPLIVPLPRLPHSLRPQAVREAR